MFDKCLECCPFPWNRQTSPLFDYNEIDDLEFESMLSQHSGTPFTANENGSGPAATGGGFWESTGFWNGFASLFRSNGSIRNRGGAVYQQIPTFDPARSSTRRHQTPSSTNNDVISENGEIDINHRLFSAEQLTITAQVLMKRDRLPVASVQPQAVNIFLEPPSPLGPESQNEEAEQETPKPKHKTQKQARRQNDTKSNTSLASNFSAFSASLDKELEEEYEKEMMRQANRKGSTSSSSIDASNFDPELLRRISDTRLQ